MLGASSRGVSRGLMMADTIGEVRELHMSIVDLTEQVYAKAVEACMADTSRSVRDVALEFHVDPAVLVHKVEAAEVRDELQPILDADPTLEVVGTGGGCDALIKRLADGGWLVLTDADLNAPSHGREPGLLVRYPYDVDGWGADGEHGEIICDNEDATARVGIRSLLRRVNLPEGEQHDAVWPVDFCHRSIREYCEEIWRIAPVRVELE